MRVLHVAESVWGGCGTYLNEILPLQINELGGDNVKVIVPEQHLGRLLAVDEAIVWTFHRTSRMAGLARLGVEIYKAIRSFRPDIVHAHSTFAGMLVRTLCAFTWNRPIVIYCPHGWAFEFSANRLVRAAVSASEFVLSYCCDQIIAISEADRLQGEQVGISCNRLVVIHNGIAKESPNLANAYWPSELRKVLFVGRLDRQKGLDILLAAVAGLEDAVSVRVVGEAVVSVRALVTDHVPAIEYVGWQSQADVIGHMNACDLLVIPSRWEGFGMVAIEAMRAGKPVIASAVGGLPEIVVDGVTGRLFPLENVETLSDMLTRDSDDELRAMGDAGRDLFHRRFTSDRLHASLMDLYARHVTMRRAAGKPGSPSKGS